MGNSHTSSTSTTDSIRSHSPTIEEVFKVDNINSYGRKHASAKIQISFDDLCIRQKRRQSLHIPLETIKRYGIDGSIFILECGRRAPMGPARYAFRCKHAERLVDALDQHITTISRQLSEQTRQDSLLSSSSTLTNVSSTINHGHCCHHRAGESQRRRTQSDHTVPRHAPSSILISSSSSSSISLTSGLTDSYRNSEPNLSENYLPFEEISHRTELSYEDEQQRPFFARLKQPIQRETKPDLNYIAIKAEILPSSTTEQGKSSISCY